MEKRGCSFRIVKLREISLSFFIIIKSSKDNLNENISNKEMIRKHNVSEKA